jgi:hypothetical protein
MEKNNSPWRPFVIKKIAFPAMLLTLGLAVAACGPATQNIPVSTDPGGAVVLLDGKEACITPCEATVEKTQDHILTLRKDGYRQVDVPVTRKYDTVGVTRQATQSGMRTSSMGANTQGAIANALLSAGAAEEDGTAYVMSPSTIAVKLIPAGQAVPAARTAPASGEGPITITTDQLDPKDRQAVIQTTEPTTAGDAIAENPEEAAKAVLEAGALATPSVGTKKEWGSSHTSETYGNGSYSSKTTSTKTSVGVSVNPAAAGLGLLNLIEDAQKTDESSAPAEGEAAQ